MDFKGALSSSTPQQGYLAANWSLPPPSFHKVQVDGASSLDGSSSSIGVIIWDSSGHTTVAMSKPHPAHYSLNAAEAIALENGILLAHELNICHVLLEFDSLSTVQSILAKKKDEPLGHIYNGIYSSLLPFCSWALNHLKQDCNRATHDLAQLAKSIRTSQVWKGSTSLLFHALLPPDPP